MGRKSTGTIKWMRNVVTARDQRQLLVPGRVASRGNVTRAPHGNATGRARVRGERGAQGEVAVLPVPMLTVSTRSPRERANAPGKSRRRHRSRTARFPRAPRIRDCSASARPRREGGAP